MSKSLKVLLDGLEYEICSKGEYKSINDVLDLDIPAVVSDDRKLSEGCLFICCRITNHNGACSIKKAIDAGAAVIAAEKGLYKEALSLANGGKAFFNGRSPVILFMEDTRYAMAYFYAAWYDHPADRMITIGITGTKGKTTVAHMIYEILKEAGHKAGLIGTMEYIIGEKHIPSPITSPEADILQEIMHEMAEEGTETVVMEVASQALMTHRSQGFTFDIGVFTNLGEDHIGPDECRDFDHYLYCKSLLMRQCRTGIVNMDDPYVSRILEGHTCEVLTYGLSGRPDLKATGMIRCFVDGVPGMEFDAADMHIRLPMPGSYSVSNALAAIQTVLELQIPKDAIVSALSRIQVNGRMTVIRPGDFGNGALPVAVVDFAHNGMSLRTLLETLKGYYSGRIFCVVSSVNTASRRKPIGEACGEFADLTIVTSDDWENDDPEEIINGITSGIREKGGAYVVIEDRGEAIRYAVSEAGAGDVVIAAGRGHIKNQKINGRICPLPDDRTLLEEALFSLQKKERENRKHEWNRKRRNNAYDAD